MSAHSPDCWRDPAHHECAVQAVIAARAEAEAIKYDADRRRLAANRLTVALNICDEQARDEGLWFIAERVTEAHLQAALRRLHAAIEGEA
jgi:hypothetical protein